MAGQTDGSSGRDLESWRAELFRRRRAAPSRVVRQPDADTREFHEVGGDGDLERLKAVLIRNPSVEIVRLLLDAGADVGLDGDVHDPLGADGWQAHIALLVLKDAYWSQHSVGQLHLDMLELLYSRGADLNPPRFWLGSATFPNAGANQMSLAIESQSLEVVKWGFSRGAVVSDELLYMASPSHEMLGYLVGEADLKDTGFYAMSKLSYEPGEPGSKDRFMQTMDILLATVPEQDRSKSLPNVLCHTVDWDDRVMIPFWLDWGVDINRHSDDGMSPLLHAAKEFPPDADLIRLLLEKGANVNYRLRGQKRRERT